MLGLLTLFLVVSSSKGFTEQNNLEDNGIMIKRGRYHVPSFMVLGAMKGGTTNLDELIRRHPLVGKIKYGKKELRFFTRDVGTFIERDEESLIAKAYQERVIGSLKEDVEPTAKRNALAFLSETQRIAKKDAKFDPSERVFLPVVTFDSTPSHLYKLEAPHTIKRALPWLSKFVVTLRNPVDRAYSHHRMRKRNFKEFNQTFEEELNLELKTMIEAGLLPRETKLFDTTEGVDSKDSTSSFRMPDSFYGSKEELAAWKRFTEMIDSSRSIRNCIITRGMYALQIRNWFHHYDIESFLFLKLEDSLETSGGIQERLGAVFDFLGLPPYNVTENKIGKMRSFLTDKNYFVTRHKETEQIEKTTKLRLEQLFEPYNKQLVSLLGPKWENPW